MAPSKRGQLGFWTILAFMGLVPLAIRIAQPSQRTWGLLAEIEPWGIGVTIAVVVGAIFERVPIGWTLRGSRAGNTRVTRKAATLRARVLRRQRYGATALLTLLLGTYVAFAAIVGEFHALGGPYLLPSVLVPPVLWFRVWRRRKSA